MSLSEIAYRNMPIDVNKSIGDSLKQLRIRAGYKTAGSFAQANKLSKMSYANIEKGQGNIRMKALVKLLHIHKITLAEFFS
jgi:DNA-binding XRE family transcriptional regulator